VDTGRESEVEAAFVAWLAADGWDVMTQVDFADVVAEREGERLVAEAKGITTSPGLDVDTMYGQILRRMTTLDGTRYGVVVPEKVVPAALRVPAEVRARLNLTVFGVAMDDMVTEHP
jgi:hypothetical protein